MKLRKMIPQQKLEATAIRRTNASTRAASMDEEEEPTMRLSTAFVVVLLLHIVAIGGVYTFDAVKVNRSSSKETAQAGEAESTTAAAAEKLAQVSPAAALASLGQGESSSASKPAANTAPTGRTTTTAAAAPAAAKADSAPAKAHASGTIHVVEKGENPVVIAKRYGVDYETLLKLNNIDDPRRLRIGQRLQIPAN